MYHACFLAHNDTRYLNSLWLATWLYRMPIEDDGWWPAIFAGLKMTLPRRLFHQWVVSATSRVRGQLTWCDSDMLASWLVYAYLCAQKQLRYVINAITLHILYLARFLKSLKYIVDTSGRADDAALLSFMFDDDTSARRAFHVTPIHRKFMKMFSANLRWHCWLPCLHMEYWWCRGPDMICFFYHVMPLVFLAPPPAGKPAHDFMTSWARAFSWARVDSRRYRPFPYENGRCSRCCESHAAFMPQLRALAPADDSMLFKQQRHSGACITWDQTCKMAKRPRRRHFIATTFISANLM